MSVNIFKKRKLIEDPRSELTFISKPPLDEVEEVYLTALRAYPNHPFKPYSPEILNSLAESIKRDGLQQPIIIWDTEDFEEYVILSGHNRVAAVRQLGEKSIPAIIRRMDKDTAAMVVVQTNLEQRQKLLPSERAYAYLMRQKATEKHKINNTDFSCDTNDCEDSGQFVRNENERQIYRYIRLTHLFFGLLEEIDSGKTPVNAGVDISHLDENAQCEVFSYFFDNNLKLNLKMAKLIRNAYEKGKAINEASMAELLSKPKMKPGSKTCTISAKLLKRYAIPEGVDVTEVICELLEERFGRV